MDILPFGFSGFQIGIATVSIMLAISGIILGVGYAANDRKLKEIGTAEIYQSVINGVLLGSLLLAFAQGGIITQLISQLTGNAGLSYSCPGFMASNSAICFAYNYLAGSSNFTLLGKSYTPLLSEVVGLLLILFGLNTGLGTIAGLSINLVVANISFSSVIMPLLKEIQYIIGILSTVAIGISMQSIILQFISVTALTAILPLGLILRAFYATRKLGGFLMAVSLGMYVVFPLSYLFNAILISTYNSGFSADQLVQATSSLSGIQNSYFQQATRNQTAENSLGSEISGAVSSILNTLSIPITALLAFLSSLIIQVFVLPAFSLVLTVVSIKEFSEVLGSEAFFGRFDML